MFDIRKMEIKRKISVYIALFFIVTLVGCKKEADVKKEYSQGVFAMDTYMTLTAYGEKGEEGVNEAIEEIQRLEQLWAVTSTTGEVSQINKNGSGEISQDTIEIVEKAQEIMEDTQGAFDITIYPLMELWGFTTGNYQVPKEEERNERLALVCGENIVLNKEDKTLTLEMGQKIDFGGIAKGYTSGKIMDMWRQKGITSGIVSLGGNVQVLGTKPDGTLWKIGVKKPGDTEGNLLGILSVSDCAVITSGGYERYFEEDGVSYHHILDTDTGAPADSGLISVTIVSRDGALADGLSTALFTMGKEDAITYWKEHKQEFEAVLVEESGEIWITEGLEDKFSTEESYQIIEE